MKRYMLLGIVVLLLSLFAATVAYADGAIVIRPDSSCNMVGANANGDFIVVGGGLVTHVVENANRIDMTCKGEGITNLSGRAQNFADFACGLIVPSGGFLLTNETRATVSANGNATMHCVFTKP